MKILSNNNGINLVELLVGMLVFVFMFGSVFFTLTTSHDTWASADSNLQIQNDARVVLERLAKELRQSGDDAVGTLKFEILDAGGYGSTDAIHFSMPVICEAGGNYLDSDGNVAYWGAPLDWGCQDSTCMDADNDCGTVDYSEVEYEVLSNNQLVRRVLDTGGAVVSNSTSVFAQDVSDFQITLSEDQRIVTLTVTISKKSSSNRMVTATNSLDVFLRNKG